MCAGFKQFIREKVVHLCCWNSLWILLFLVGMGFFFIGMPKYVDDYWYMLHLRGWFAGQGVVFPEDGGNIFRAGIPFREIWDTWVEHYGNDNVRLGNLLAPVLLIFPKWVSSGLVLLMLASIIFMSFRLASVDWRHSRLVPLAIFGWTFSLPWRDAFGSLVFQMNYVFSSWLALVLVSLLFGKQQLKNSTLSKAGFFMLGLATGMSHEVVGIPIGCGLLFMFIVTKKFRTTHVLFAMIGLACGVLALVTCPGMILRVTQNAGGINRSPWYGFININDSVPFIIMMLLSFVVFFIRKGIAEKERYLLMFCIVTAVIGVILVYITFWWGRIGFLVNVVSIIASLECLRVIIVRYRLQRNVWNMCGSIVLLCTVYLYLGYVGYYSLVFRKFLREQIASYVQSPDKDFWGEVIMLNKLPAICGYLPDNHFNGYCMEYVRDYYAFGERREAGDQYILPERLKTVDSNSGSPIEGGDIRILDGFYFIPLSSIEVDDKYGVMSFKFDFGKGWTCAPCTYKVFKSERDGKEYVFIKPKLDWYVTHFKKLKGMRFEP